VKPPRAAQALLALLSFVTPALAALPLLDMRFVF
jgi:hypothetical protein